MAKIKKIKLPNDETLYELEGSITDISNTTSNIDSITTDYPDISASDKASTLFGKIKKFLSDLKSNKQDSLLMGNPTATDFNELTTPGIYWINISTTNTNAPFSSGYGFLEVWRQTATGVILQRFTKYSNGLMAERMYVNSQWYAWNNKAYMWTDSEGGNINITSKSGTYRTQMDMYDDTTFRMYHSSPSAEVAGGIYHSYDKTANLDYLNGVSSNIQTQLNNKLSLSGGTMTGHLTTSAQIRFQAISKLYNSSNWLILGCTNGVTARDYSTIGTFKPMEASAFNKSSSKLVKENIKDLSEDEAKKILNIRTVSFDYIKQAGGEKNQRGVIAEEVLNFIPSVVDIPDNYNEEAEKQKIQNNSDELLNTIGVDYSKFVPYLIKMIQIQQNEIDELKNKIVALKELIEY